MAVSKTSFMYCIGACIMAITYWAYIDYEQLGDEGVYKVINASHTSYHHTPMEKEDQSVTMFPHKSDISGSTEAHDICNCTTSPITDVPASFFTANKSILFYNSFYMWTDYRFGKGVNPFIDKCGRSDCWTTTNHSELATADVVIFYATLLAHSRRVAPNRSHDKQLYVFFDTEPAKRNMLIYFGSKINFTITYRKDSSISWPYGIYIPRTSRDEPYVPLSIEQVNNKTTMIGWMLSNYGKQGTARTEYGDELMKYVSMHVYGRYGNYTCDKQKTKACMQMMERDYMFYLSFENSIVEDYISEKCWRTLEYNLVPIVMGGGNYARDLPPGSYIDTKDFPSPKHLAEYLIHLDKNPQEYLKYLEWKTHYKTRQLHRNSTDVFCDLCEKLHNPKTEYYQNFDVAEWWAGEDHGTWTKKDMYELFHVYGQNDSIADSSQA